VNGLLQERAHYPIGHATNYSTPGVGGGKLYVGTRDGKVLAFGAPVSQPLSGSGASFPTTTVGQSSQQTLTLTANAAVTIQSASSNSSQFALGTATPAIPATLAKGATISIPVTFTPSGTGLQGAQVTISTSAGSEAFSVSGTGQTAPPKLASDTKLLTLPGIAVGAHTSGTVTFSNIGAQKLTVSAVHAPAAPFTLSGAPSAGATIAPGGSITINVNFDPTSAGTYNDVLGLDSDGGNLSVGLSGTASTPGQLQINPLSTDYGNVVVGDSVSKSFTVKNVGGTTVTINKSKPPFGGEFSNTTTLDEGTSVQPGETLTESVTFAPTATGAASGTWPITGDDSTGLHTIQFTGTGIPPLAGSGLTFGTTTVGQSSSPLTLTLTANKALAVQTIGATGDFATGTPSRALPASLAKGATISVPVTFSPSKAGAASGQVNVTTDAGSQAFSLSGTGELAPAQLTVEESSVSFGTAVIGSPVTKAITFTNTGGQTLTLGFLSTPSAPFTAADAPAANGTIAAGDSLTVHVKFDPSSAGQYSDALELDSDGGNVSVGLAGAAVTPGQLQISPAATDFGDVPVGDTSSKSFTITNVGGTTVTIGTSIPPSGPAFTATTSIVPGTEVQPGDSLTESVAFAPPDTGASNDTWRITDDDPTGTYAIPLTGNGTQPQTSSTNTFSQTSTSTTTTTTFTTTTTTTTSQTSSRAKVPQAPKLQPTTVTANKLSALWVSYAATMHANAEFTLQRVATGRVQRAVRGHSVTRACVSARGRVATAERCTRYITLATFSHRDRVGSNRVRLTAYVSWKKLIPGTYRLTSVLIDSSFIKHTFHATVRVIPAPPPPKPRHAHRR
jgi:hypothetical protein